MASLFKMQAKVASKLGIAPTTVRSAWIVDVMREIGMPVPPFWEGLAGRGATQCPGRYRTVIIEVLREGAE